MKILADSMGLGKTIMTIALLSHSGRGGLSSKTSNENSESGNMLDDSPTSSKKATKFSGFDKAQKQQNSLAAGGNLIICPMTLIGQWKV